ncbi:MAG: hypothetical protein ACYDAL_13740 [Candidatus Dormibacteraceae bacterium]
MPTEARAREKGYLPIAGCGIIGDCGQQAQAVGTLRGGQISRSLWAELGHAADLAAGRRQERDASNWDVRGGNHSWYLAGTTNIAHLPGDNPPTPSPKPPVYHVPPDPATGQVLASPIPSTVPFPGAGQPNRFQQPSKMSVVG